MAVRLRDDLLSLLTPATSFQRVTPFSWDIIPANTMAYDNQQFAGDRGDDNLGNPDCWTETDKANLEMRQKGPIRIGDIAYGRFEAQQKRNAEWVYQKMSRGEKESFRMKLAEIDEADANNGQSPPPTPTPV